MVENDSLLLTYTVREQKDRFEVCTAAGRVVLNCGDEVSASHYASLLNEAHRAGYKAGFRDGRKRR